MARLNCSLSKARRIRCGLLAIGKGKGVVAYTLLANHVPLQSQLIGANEHESHYVFDMCYHNTTDITPNAITGDMHSVNKANFAILHWFDFKLEPRFTLAGSAQAPFLRQRSYGIPELLDPTCWPNR
jgi:hypothetical protein